ncbi:MAG: GAF domain-containing protein [Chloroflexi bacterium]|nr:GAF domain-containing protein [Chloroflexota bacterium]
MLLLNLNLPPINGDSLQMIALGLNVGPILIGATLLGWLTDQIRGYSTDAEEQKNFNTARRDSKGKTLEREIQKLKIMVHMATALNSSLDYEYVLRMALDLGTSALADSKQDETRIKSAVLLFERGALYLASARGMSQSDLTTTFPGKSGILGEAVTTGERAFSHDPPRDPELRRLSALHTSRSAVCIPLRIGLELYGVLLYAHPRQNYFKIDRMELLEIVSQQAMIALQNALLYYELEQEKEHIMEIHEQARQKLARDLHDGPTQSVAAIAMRINFARRLLDRDPRETASELFKTEELARQTSKEIRQMLFTMRPLILESKGLVAALEQLAVKMEDAHKQIVVVEATPDIAEALDLKKQGLIFSITEEAVNNARKHAQAERIWVRLSRRGDLLELEIEDNGVGFNLSSVDAGYDQRGSLGMLNMRERAELLNGQLHIDSSAGRGTRITLLIPLTNEATNSLRRPGFATHEVPLEHAGSIR